MKEKETVRLDYESTMAIKKAVNQGWVKDISIRIDIEHGEPEKVSICVANHDGANKNFHTESMCKLMSLLDMEERSPLIKHVAKFVAWAKSIRIEKLPQNKRAVNMTAKDSKYEVVLSEEEFSMVTRSWINAQAN